MTAGELESAGTRKKLVYIPLPTHMMPLRM
jgi:hypothetical protein